MSAWSGPKVTALRRQYAQRIATRAAQGDPYPCPHCPHPVLPGQPWDLDHITPRSQGGAVWDPANITPAHAACNRRDGQRLTTQRNQRTRRW